jgi:hypothetical protein
MKTAFKNTIKLKMRKIIVNCKGVILKLIKPLSLSLSLYIYIYIYIYMLQLCIIYSWSRLVEGPLTLTCIKWNMLLFCSQNSNHFVHDTHLGELEYSEGYEAALHSNLSKSS